MSDAVGSVTAARLPVLERVLREETLAREHGRQSQNKRPARTQAQGGKSQEDAGDEQPVSTNHINFRV